jgi:hypothetical protein
MTHSIKNSKWSAAQTLAWIIRQEPLELRKWASDMGSQLEPAAKKLSEAIGGGDVNAWGRPEPHALTERIPNDQFSIQDITLIVTPHGDLATLPRHRLFSYKGRRWHGIEFEADGVKKVFPGPPPVSAMEWMQNEAQGQAENGCIPKRDVIIQDCMGATGCTKRQAAAAHKALPDNLKRRRGKPTKNGG